MKFDIRFAFGYYCIWIFWQNI